MLTLTENATTAVKTLTEQADIPGGLRIGPAEEPARGYAVTLTTQPGPDDEVVEQDGARIFLDPTAAIALDDRVLDAEVDDDGSVGFTLAARG